jgi:type VI secretion system protein ImpK
MQKIDEIIGPCLDAIRQIQHADVKDLPDVGHIQTQFRAIIDRLAPRASKEGFSEDAIDDVRYALVALADEVIMSKGGDLREAWMQHTLQMRYYNENIAGEHFFDRLENLQGDPARHATLRVYYLCMLLGFQGRYRIRGGELQLADVMDQVKNELAENNATPLSPRGARPYEALTDIRRNLLLLCIAIVGASASVLLFVVLRLRISQQAANLLERITALVGGS